MVETISQLIRAHRITWIWCGLWAPPSRRYSFIYHVYAALLFASIFICTVSNLMSLGSARNMLDINDIALPPIMFVLILIKTAETWRNRHRIRRAFGQLAELHSALIQGNANRMLAQRAEYRVVRSCRWLAICMCIAGTSCLTAKFMWTLGQSERKLMFVAVLPFDWERCGAVLFYSTISIQYGVALMGSLIISTLDIFAPSMYAILCTYLELLGERMARIGRGAGDGGGGEVERIHYAELMECVRLHKLCLALSSNFERIYSVHLFAQLGITSLGLCAVCFSMSSLDLIANPAFSVHFGMCGIVLTLEILLPCYYGSILTESSHDLLRRAFASAWIDRTARFRSTIGLFVENAKRPILLRTYAGFFHINLPTFVAVMRMAYTLVSFCSQLM